MPIENWTSIRLTTHSKTQADISQQSEDLNQCPLDAKACSTFALYSESEGIDEKLNISSFSKTLWESMCVFPPLKAQDKDNSGRSQFSEETSLETAALFNPSALIFVLAIINYHEHGDFNVPSSRGHGFLYRSQPESYSQQVPLIFTSASLFSVLFVFVRVTVHATVQMWRSVDHCQELVLIFPLCPWGSAHLAFAASHGSCELNSGLTKPRFLPSHVLCPLPLSRLRTPMITQHPLGNSKSSPFVRAWWLTALALSAISILLHSRRWTCYPFLGLRCRNLRGGRQYSLYHKFFFIFLYFLFALLLPDIYKEIREPLVSEELTRHPRSTISSWQCWMWDIPLGWELGSWNRWLTSLRNAHQAMTSGNQDISHLGNQVNINIQPSITAIWKKLGSEGLPVRPCCSIYLCSWRFQTSFSVISASAKSIGLSFSLELKHTTFVYACGRKHWQQTGQSRDRCSYLQV